MPTKRGKNNHSCAGYDYKMPLAGATPLPSRGGGGGRHGQEQQPIL